MFNVLSSNALAQIKTVEECRSLGISPTAILFGNGIDTIEEAAKDSKRVLLRAVFDDLPNAASNDTFACLDFDVAYNGTNGAFRDFIESVTQAFDIEGVDILFWQWVGGVMDLSTPRLPDIFQDAMVRVAVEFNAGVLTREDVLNEHIVKYRQKLCEGKKIVVVSHSQGNFFANVIYDRLSLGEKESFGIVSVANPDDRVAGGGRYTTFEFDLVIFVLQAAGALDPNVFEPNRVDIPGPRSNTPHDPLQHNFIREYLKAKSKTKAKILTDLYWTRGRLQEPVGDACVPLPDDPAPSLDPSSLPPLPPVDPPGPFPVDPTPSFIGLGAFTDGSGRRATGPFAISADGLVVVGGRGPNRWTADEGTIYLGDLTVGIGVATRQVAPGSARSVSADGSVIVGGQGQDRVFRWTKDGGMATLGDIPGFNAITGEVYGVSADGSVVVGSDLIGAIRWTLNDGPGIRSGHGRVYIGSLLEDAPWGKNRAFGISADGLVIVGVDDSLGHDEAFRWTVDSGMVGLGDLPGGVLGSQAFAVSRDGSVIVGVGKAFLWDSINGMQSLKDILNDLGVQDMDRWSNTEATGISANGMTIVGHGTNPSGTTEGWIIRLE